MSDYEAKHFNCPFCHVPCKAIKDLKAEKPVVVTHGSPQCEEYVSTISIGEFLRIANKGVQ